MSKDLGWVLVDGAWDPPGEDGPWVAPGFVRYPPPQWPEEAPPALAVPHTELPQEHQLDYIKDMEWARTHSPVAAVESIIMRHRAGVFPSVAVMEWLAAGLEDWHSHQGHKSLEQCLGLKKGSGHAANQMKEATRAQMVDSLLQQMLRLHCAFGITIKAAAQILAAWTEDPAFNQSTFQFRPLSEDTLLAYWSDTEWVKDSGVKHRWRGHLQGMSDDWKRALLDQYPRHAWEHLPELQGYR